jgi:hypothetical protein
MLSNKKNLHHKNLESSKNVLKAWQTIEEDIKDFNKKTMTQNCSFCDNVDKKKLCAIDIKTVKCKRNYNHCNWNCLKNLPYVFENQIKV